MDTRSIETQRCIQDPLALPIIKTYAAWLGLRSHDKLRIVLFVLGTLFALIMATATTSTFLMDSD
ncbi:MAG: hypothetical protein R3C02_09365 [Planctomycetaceae bacterium]